MDSLLIESDRFDRSEIEKSLSELVRFDLTTYFDTRRAMMGLNALIFIVGSTAGIPYFKLARDYAGDAVFFGWVLGICTLLGEAAISIWAYLNLIDNIKLRSIASKNRKKMSILYNTVFYGSVVFLAMMAQIPNTYISYKYNNSNYFYPIITLLNDFGLRLYAVEQFITVIISLFDILIKKCSAQYDNASSATRKKNRILNLISLWIINVEANQMSQVSALIPEKEKLNNDQEGNHEVFTLTTFLGQLKNLSDLSHESDTPVTAWYQLLKFIFILISYLFPTAILAYQIKETIEFSSKLGGVFAVLVPILSITPLIYLEYAVIHTRVSKIMDNTLGQFFGYVKAPILQKQFPVRTIIGSFLAFLIGVFTFGPRAQITESNFSGVLGNIFIVLIISGAILFESNALIEVFYRFNKTISYSYKANGFDQKLGLLTFLNNLKDILLFSDANESSQLIDIMLPVDEDDSLIQPVNGRRHLLSYGCFRPMHWCFNRCFPREPDSMDADVQLLQRVN